MDIKQIRYFVTIVEEGTISKAAMKLHMAQPPLSIQLKSLEDELGVELLTRGRRRVTLTPAGKLLYKRSLQILSLYELTLNDMKDITKQSLRIGITSSNSTVIQQKHILDFMNNHPKLNIRIKEGATDEMIDLLTTHDIDIAIVRTPFDSRNVSAIYFQKDPMIAVGPKDMMKDITHISDIIHFPLIIHRRYHSLITEYCLNSLQMYPNVQIQSDDARTSIIWAQTLRSIAIIPKSTLSLVNQKELSYVELKDEQLYTSIALITRKKETLSPIANEFISLFK